MGKNGQKISTGLSGVAGEYFVAGELSRRGFLATLTQRNAKGIDILVSNADASKSSAVQVKTNQGRQTYWLLTSKAENFHAPSLFYVFVNLGTEDGVPEYYVVLSGVVAAYIKENHAAWLKAPGKKGKPHQDTPMRQFHLGDKEKDYRNRWDMLGLD